MFKRLKDAAGNAFDRAGSAVTTAAKSATASVSDAIGNAVDKAGDMALEGAKSAAVGVGDVVDMAVGKVDDATKGHLVKAANSALDAVDATAELVRSVNQIPYVGTAMDIVTGEKLRKIAVSAVKDTVDESDRREDGTMPCPIADIAQLATKVVRVAINGNSAEVIAEQVGKSKTEKPVKALAASKGKKIVL